MPEQPAEMISTTDDLPLAAEFPPASYDDWRRLVDGVLKGASFDKLISRSYDSLKIEPIYTRAKGATPVPGRAAAAPWQVMQRVDHPDPAKANAQALHDLDNGATGLCLVFAGCNAARGFGLPGDAETVERVLNGIVLDAGISIDLQLGTQTRMAAIHVAEWVKRKGFDPAACDIHFGLDPIGACAVRGTSALSLAEMSAGVSNAVKGLASSGFKGPFVAADGRVIHNAGGSEVQELGFALASAVAYLRALEGGGIDLERARAAISFHLAADADQFLTMAKFRALRVLWARVEAACGLAPRSVFIAAETAWRMLSRRDPYVNMLRATIATFSGGLAGANAITVLPHTLALGLPDAFARRIARNTQLILLEESNLAKVSDPAAGSGGIESLTKQLCEASWSLFQEIEKAGGAFACLEQGLIQAKVATTRRAREGNIARRKDVLTGASEFPNLHEGQVAVEDVPPVQPFPEPPAALTFEPLVSMRLAEPFEALRDRSDQILKGRGKRPSVFLANLGRASDFTARATFATSFFEAGGIEAVHGEAFLPSRGGAGGREVGDAGSSQDFAPLAAAYKASHADFACLCSSDRIYAEFGLDAARALQIAGTRHTYLAGRPGDLEASLKTAGVDTFIFAGGDALAVLQDAYRLMEQS